MQRFLLPGTGQSRINKKYLVFFIYFVCFACAGVTTQVAHAEDPTRELTINQVRSAAWPTVTINFGLQSLDDTGLGEVRAEQFTVEENGAVQQIAQVAAGGDANVPPLSVVMVLDVSGSMEG